MQTASTKKTHEHYSISVPIEQEAVGVVGELVPQRDPVQISVEVDLVNGRITLAKPNHLRGNRYEYTFQNSKPETVEAVALGLLEAVRVAREATK